MKKVLIVLLAVFIFPVYVNAAERHLEWSQSLGADGYKVQISDDSGVTWTIIQGLNYATFEEGSKKLAKATILIPDGLLILGRVGAIFGNKTVWKYESGFWYNSALKKKKLPEPTGLSTD